MTTARDIIPLRVPLSRLIADYSNKYIRKGAAVLEYCYDSRRDEVVLEIMLPGNKEEIKKDEVVDYNSSWVKNDVGSYSPDSPLYKEARR